MTEIRTEESKLRRYLIQCGLAAGTIFVVLLAVDSVFRTDVVATLGATTCIVFAAPRLRSARLRALLGGYLAGIVSGVAWSALHQWIGPSLGPLSFYGKIVFGALAVGSAVMLMLLTSTVHPPAAGMALSLVVSPWDWRTLLFVLSAVLLLSAARHFLSPKLIDLV